MVPTAFLTGTAKQTALVDKLTGTANGQLGSANAKSKIKKYGFGNLAYLGDPAEYKSGAYRH